MLVELLEPVELPAVRWHSSGSCRPQAQDSQDKRRDSMLKQGSQGSSRAASNRSVTLKRSSGYIRLLHSVKPLPSQLVRKHSSVPELLARDQSWLQLAGRDIPSAKVADAKLCVEYNLVATLFREYGNFSSSLSKKEGF